MLVTFIKPKKKKKTCFGLSFCHLWFSLYVKGDAEIRYQYILSAQMNHFVSFVFPNYINLTELRNVKKAQKYGEKG